MSYRKALLVQEVQVLQGTLGVLVQRLINDGEDEAASYLESGADYLKHVLAAINRPREKKKKR